MTAKLSAAQVLEGVIKSPAKTEKEKAELLCRVVGSLTSPAAVAPVLELLVGRKCGRGTALLNNSKAGPRLDGHGWGAFAAVDGLDEELDRSGHLNDQTAGMLCRTVVQAIANRGAGFLQSVAEYFAVPKRLLTVLDLADLTSYTESLRLLLLVLRIKRAFIASTMSGSLFISAGDAIDKSLAADTALVRTVLMSRVATKPTPARALITAGDATPQFCAEVYLLRLMLEFFLPAERVARPTAADTTARRTDWMRGFLQHFYSVLPLPSGGDQGKGNSDGDDEALQLQFNAVNRLSITYLQQLLGDEHVEYVPATVLLQQLFDLLGDFELIRSPALASLLENMPEQVIGQTVAQLALPMTTDLALFESSLESIVRQIAAWPLTPKLAKWIATFVSVLIKTRRLGLLAKLSSGLALPIFVQLFVPQLFNSAFSILETILLGYRHSPDAFHKIIHVFPRLIAHALVTSDDLYTSSPILQYPNDVHIIPSFIFQAMQAASLFVSSASSSQPASSSSSQPAAASSSSSSSSSSSPPESSEQPEEPESEPLEESAVELPEVPEHRSEATDLRIKRLCRLFTQLSMMHTGFPELYKPMSQLMAHLVSKGIALAEVGELEVQALMVGNEAWKEVPISDYALAPVETKVERTPVGLVNLGNTCYMNSFLQMLNLVAPFREAVLSLAVEQTRSNRDLDEMQRLFAFLELTKRRAYNPRSFLKMLPPWFAQGQQQDASEFGKFLLDRLETAFKNCPGLHDVVQRTFGGELLSQVACHGCNRVSASRQSFNDLSLNFPSAEGDGRKKAVCIEELLTGFFAAESMTGDNRYHCEHCGGLQDAERVVTLADAPQHLLVTLQRFTFDRVKMRPDKIRTPVRFAELLRIPVIAAKTEESNAVACADDGEGEDDAGECSSTRLVDYELFGLVMHSGSSAQFGHYYAYGRQSQRPLPIPSSSSSSSSSSPSSPPLNGDSEPTEQPDAAASSAEEASREVEGERNDNRWFCFNDARVQASRFEQFEDISSVFTTDVPYILAYRRRDGPPCIDRTGDIPAERREEVQRDDKALATERVSRSKWSRNELGWASSGARYSSVTSRAVGIALAAVPFGTPPPTCSDSGWQQSGNYGF